jgi:hypothetical protein
MEEKKAKHDYYRTQILLPKSIRQVLENEANKNGLTPGVFMRMLVMQDLHKKKLIKDQ